MIIYIKYNFPRFKRLRAANTFDEDTVTYLRIHITYQFERKQKSYSGKIVEGQRPSNGHLNGFCLNICNDLQGYLRLQGHI